MNRNVKPFIAQNIRAQYMDKQASDLDELRALAAEVKKPANIFGYVFGNISAITIGLVGIGILAEACPVYNLCYPERAGTDRTGNTHTDR